MQILRSLTLWLLVCPSVFGQDYPSIPTEPKPGDAMLADGLISWLAGQPNVAAGVKRAGGGRMFGQQAKDETSRPPEFCADRNRLFS